MARRLQPRDRDSQDQPSPPDEVREAMVGAAATRRGEYGPGDDLDEDDGDEDLSLFDWAGRKPSFFEWANSGPQLEDELAADAAMVRHALQTLAMIEALESFYGVDLFWAELTGTEYREPPAVPPVDPRAAYAKLPKGTIPSRL